MGSYFERSDLSPAEYPGVTLVCPGKPDRQISSETYGETTAGELRYIPDNSLHEWKEEEPGSRDRSFTKIKRSGRIVMSNYSVGKISTEYMISQRPRVLTWRRSPWASKNGVCCSGPHDWTGVSTWTENDDLSSLSELGLYHHRQPLGELHPKMISRSIAATQAESFASSLSGYDLLTEMAEAKQTLDLLAEPVMGAAKVFERIRAKEPYLLKKFKRFNYKQLLRIGGPAGKLASLWLTYRYGVMPLIYSYKTIIEELESSGYYYNTERAFEVRQEWEDIGAIDSLRYLSSTIFGVVSVESITKSRHSGTILRRLADRTSFNVLKTAWELIPLSFVIDWFVNVGDQITNFTSIDTAAERLSCTMVRSNITKRTYVIDKTQDVSAWSSNANPCRGSINFYDTFDRDIQDVLYQQTVKSYKRFVWRKPEPKLTFNPNLTWRRMVDAVALSLRPSLNFLRKL